MIADYRIVGTRITVWDVLHHLENGWSIEEIAEIYCLKTAEIQAAAEYIESHRSELMKVHREIEERNARGNPPGAQARIEKARKQRMEWREHRQRAATR